MSRADTILVRDILSRIGHYQLSAAQEAYILQALEDEFARLKSLRSDGCSPKFWCCPLARAFTWRGSADGSEFWAIISDHSVPHKLRDMV